MANSALGTLLATRLDAVLGTTLAQHPVLLTGARSHNVAQATSAVHPQDSVIQRGSRQAAEVDARGARPGAAGVARGGASAAGLLAGKGELPGGIQPSARATLSEPARTILALLLSRGDAGAGVQGRMPLWDANAAAAQRGARGAAGGGSAPSGATGAGAGTSQPSQDGTARSASSAVNPGQAVSAAEANAAARLAAISAGLAGKPSATAQAAASTGADATRLKVPEGMVRMLAQSLGQTVSHSGLFYESHLAQMVFGKRGLGELLKEPQALMGRPGGAAQTGHVPAGGTDTMPGAAGGGDSAGPNTGAQATHTMGSSAGTVSSPGSAVGGSGLAGYSDASASATGTVTGTNTSSLNANLPVPGIHPDAAPLVRQQLETLASNAFHWQGEAWPGAPMQWEVNEDAGRPGTDEPSTWATRLRLQLPSLGEVEARISLAGDRLVVRLVAPESAPVLQEHASTLRENLLAGGLTLTDLTVLKQPAVEPGSVGNPPAASGEFGGNTTGDTSQNRDTAGGPGILPAHDPYGASSHGASTDKGSQP